MDPLLNPRNSERKLGLPPELNQVAPTGVAPLTASASRPACSRERGVAALTASSLAPPMVW